jgi:hypothetical protein
MASTIAACMMQLQRFGLLELLRACIALHSDCTPWLDDRLPRIVKTQRLERVRREALRHATQSPRSTWR